MTHNKSTQFYFKSLYTINSWSTKKMHSSFYCNKVITGISAISASARFMHTSSSTKYVQLPTGAFSIVKRTSVELPEKVKKLFYTYGIKRRLPVFLKTNFGYNSRFKALNLHIKNKHFDTLQENANRSLIGNKLKRSILDCIAYSAEAKTYRSIRHKLSLPVRGQRTRTNAQTSKNRFKKKRVKKITKK